MLFTKCILDDREETDGLRISVMSRHTKNDGVTPDTRLTDWDIHIPKLGPSPKLIGDYYKRDLLWDAFKERYLEEIRTPFKTKLVLAICNIALLENVTLLCIEETDEHCHRSLLYAECKRLFPSI